MRPLPDYLPAHLSALIGQSVHAVDTPSLVIDCDAMQRNLSRMAEFAKKHHIRWRPHAKLHKCAELAQAQMRAGAVGVCVQKTAEAEALLAGGVYDIYISNEVIAPHKLARVAALAQGAAAHGGKLAIAVDSSEGVIRLVQAMNNARAASGAATMIDVFIEIDVGQGRCGVAPGSAAVQLALEIQQHPALHFAGLQAYQGKAQHIRSAQGRRAAIALAVQAVAMTRQLIEAQGLAVKLVTGAGTGSFLLEAASGVYGELQVGSFLLMDADYAGNEPELAQPAFEHALFVKTQIISTHADYVVCDAGHKSHAIDSGLPRVWWPEGRAALTYFNGGDEHGILRAAAPGSTDQPDSVLPALGQTLWLIPGHCDPTLSICTTT
jgi:D-serine deaminase-like pyridoxal phosphate-dependent protein